MPFAHTVNCTLLNVRFKSQTTSLRLYEDCRIKLLFLRRVIILSLPVLFSSYILMNSETLKKLTLLMKEFIFLNLEMSKNLF